MLCEQDCEGQTYIADAGDSDFVGAVRGDRFGALRLCGIEGFAPGRDSTREERQGKFFHEAIVFS